MISRLKRLRRPSKKPLLILAGVTLGIVAIASGGWWYNANRATNDYRAQASSHLEDVKTELAGIVTQFKGLAAEGDTKKNAEALAAFRTSLLKQANNTPTLPQLFGITLTVAQDGQKRNELIRQIEQLAQDIQKAHELLAYEESAGAVLQEVTTKTGADATQQQALAEAWLAMSNKLKALTPPSEAAGIHQQITTAVAAAQAKIATLSDLFTKKDVNGFAVRQKEIEVHINELRSHGDAIQLLNVNHDKAIARDYQKLQEMLK